MPRVWSQGGSSQGFKLTMTLSDSFRTYLLILRNFVSLYPPIANSDRRSRASLRIIPTPWEVTLSKLLSIVSDFEREEHLKYKLA